MSDDPDKVKLDALAPREAWTNRLPAVGREAARRRAAGGLGRAARWFLPLAAGVAAMCWLLVVRAPPAPQTRNAVLLLGTDGQAVALLAVEAGP